MFFIERKVFLLLIVLMMASLVVIDGLASHKEGPRQATLLRTAGKFLFDRHLAFCADLSLTLAENAQAYDQTGRDAIASFISAYDFDFPVASLKASVKTNSVSIEYDDESPLRREILRFRGDKIENIETDILDESSNYRDHSVYQRRISQCGGAESATMVAALQSVRISKLATEFLFYDVLRDLSNQAAYLTENSVAFGYKGREAIIAAQEMGISASTHYTLPYAVQINVDASCASVDFDAHFLSKEQTSFAERWDKQRGTDIMYVDVLEDKVLRIDTLRHTLTQPSWVKKHFSLS